MNKSTVGLLALLLAGSVSAVEINYSTYLGEIGLVASDPGVATDNQENIYVSGRIIAKFSPSMELNEVIPEIGTPNIAIDNQGYIYTAGGGGYGMIAITKASPTGKIVYSVTLGGSGEDSAFGIAVDQWGYATVVGETYSEDFPTTPNAIQPTFGSSAPLNPPADAFVVKLNPDGTVLYSTYLGGEQSEIGWGVATDSRGNAYVVGQTNSEDFPATRRAFQTALNGDRDAFITKINPDGSRLIYSTFLGGSSGEDARGIVVDNRGHAYILGGTGSEDFPLRNPAQGERGGWSDFFITKLNAQGTGLIYSTYLGGSSFEEGRAIAVNARGEVFVGGVTGSPDFPTHNAAQDTLPEAPHPYATGAAGFVAKLNAQGNRFEYSTYLGGWRSDKITGIALDRQSNAYVTGMTSSPDFPTTPDALQPEPILGHSGIPLGGPFLTKLTEPRPQLRGPLRRR